MHLVIAQMVERWTVVPLAGGSNPSREKYIFIKPYKYTMHSIQSFVNTHMIPYLSTYVLPIVFISYYFFIPVRAYFAPHFIAIFITGISDSLRNKKNYWLQLATIICHSPLLIFPFIFKPTVVPHLLLGIGILYILAISVFIGIPKWHYVLTRKQFIKIYTISLLLVLLILPQYPEYYPI